LAARWSFPYGGLQQKALSELVLHIDHERWGQTQADLRHLALSATYARSRERFLGIAQTGAIPRKRSTMPLISLILGSMAICARLSIWNVPSVSACRIMA